MKPSYILFGDRTAPDGSLVRENFARWFGDSRMVGRSGLPRVLYHGTAGDFSAFDLDRRGRNTRAGDARAGFFFAENPRAADQFTWADGEKTGAIMPVYLRVLNPFVTSHVLDGTTGTRAGKIIAQARLSGHDGVVFENSDMLGHTGFTCVVFEPNQIKSAIGNSGLFDSSSPDLVDRHEWEIAADRPREERMRA